MRFGAHEKSCAACARQRVSSTNGGGGGYEIRAHIARPRRSHKRRQASRHSLQHAIVHIHSRHYTPIYAHHCSIFGTQNQAEISLCAYSFLAPFQTAPGERASCPFSPPTLNGRDARSPDRAVIDFQRGCPRRLLCLQYWNTDASLRRIWQNLRGYALAFAFQLVSYSPPHCGEGHRQ